MFQSGVTTNRTLVAHLMLIGLSVLWYLTFRNVFHFKVTQAHSAGKGP